MAAMVRCLLRDGVDRGDFAGDLTAGRDNELVECVDRFHDFAVDG